jgi:RNA polymerase sigma-70 factor (ECF subfamily)
MKAAGSRVDPSGPKPDHAAEALRFFDDHAASLLRFCRAALGNGADAEDIVQDTFVKLLQHLNGEGNRTNLRAWLFTVAAHACRDRARWKTRWLPWRPELDTRVVAPVDSRPDESRARAALARLASRDRLLLSLRAQGLSYRDIAAASGVRERSVGRLLARALDRWKKSFETAGG